MKQPTSLACQSIKVLVNQALIIQDTKPLSEVPNDLKPAAYYLYEANNNPTIALFNNYLDLHDHPDAHNDATNFLKSCNANAELVNQLIAVLKQYDWDLQKAFDWALVKKMIVNIEGIKLFVSSKVGKKINLNKINEFSSRNTTALNRAIETGDIGLIKLLIDLGADVNLETLWERESLTPLFDAVYTAVAQRMQEPKRAHGILNQYKEIINLLIDAGADVNKKIFNGDSVLQAAGYDSELIQFLREKGAVGLIHPCEYIKDYEISELREFR